MNGEQEKRIAELERARALLERLATAAGSVEPYLYRYDFVDDSVACLDCQSSQSAGEPLPLPHKPNCPVRELREALDDYYEQTKKGEGDGQDSGQ